MKLFISIPCADKKMFYKTTKSIFRLNKILDNLKIGYTISFNSGSLITRIRNNEVYKFLNSDCSHLLFIDSDVYGFEEHILKLLISKKDVVGISYPLKQFDNNLLTINKAQNKDLFKTSTRFNINLESNDLNLELSKIDENGFLKVKHMPTGCLLINKNVFDKLKLKVESYIDYSKKIYNYFNTFIKNNNYLSEDYAFCQLCNENNIDIYCLTTANIYHIGNFDYHGNLKEMIEKYKFFSLIK